jgi:hypothetical protein
MVNKTGNKSVVYAVAIFRFPVGLLPSKNGETKGDTFLSILIQNRRFK